jgi:hypothetical protein
MISRQVIQRAFILVAIILVAILLVLPLYNRTSNLGRSIGNLRILNKNTISYLSNVSKPYNYVIFYSLSCKSCEYLLPLFKKQKNITLVCLDSENINTDTSMFKLIDREMVKIRYLPYIVRVDSNHKIIQELKLDEIKNQLKI